MLHASGHSLPWHLPTRQSVSGHFPSIHSCIRVFSFWMQLCQGVFLLDPAVSGQMASRRRISWHHVSRSCLDYSVGLDRQRRLPWERALLLALPAYSHFPVSSPFRRTHVPLVVTLPAYSHAAHTHTCGVLTCRSSFSQYPSRLACSRRVRFTRLAWARCSRGIRHTRHGLITVLSHALRGLVVLAVSVTPGVVLSRSSHTPCVGSLF